MPDPIMSVAPTATADKAKRAALEAEIASLKAELEAPVPAQPEKPIPVFFQSIWTSVVRTFVPQVVAVIVVILAKVQLEVDSDVIVLAVSEAFAIAYYMIVRGLEEFRSTKYGRLLGRAARPMYFSPDA